MEKKTTYRPISCDFHDELQLLALRRTVVPIHFRTPGGEEVTVESKITDLYTREGEEFLLLPTNEEIRLDRLVSVNGLELKKYC